MPANNTIAPDPILGTSGLPVYTGQIPTDVLPIADVTLNITKRITLTSLFDDLSQNVTGGRVTASGGMLIGGSNAVGTIPLVVKAVAGQSVEGFQYQDSGGNAKVAISAAGTFALRAFTVPISVSLAGDVKQYFCQEVGNPLINQWLFSKNAGSFLAVVGAPSSLVANTVPKMSAVGELTSSLLLDNGTTVVVAGSFLPSLAGTYDLGQTTIPFRDLYLAGTSGTPGTNNFKITGVATAPRTITLPDASGNVAVIAGSIVVAAGKVFTVNNTLTLAGTDGTVMTFPSTSATIARTDAGNTFTGTNNFAGATFSGAVICNSLLRLFTANNSFETGNAACAIYTTGNGGGAYPFLESVNLIISSRENSQRDIILVNDPAGTPAYLTWDRNARLIFGLGSVASAPALLASGTILKARLGDNSADCAFTALSFNKVTVTAPASGSTLTIADGKTLAVSNTLTFTGIDASSAEFGSGGTVPMIVAKNVSLNLNTTSTQAIFTVATGKKLIVVALMVHDSTVNLQSSGNSYQFGYNGNADDLCSDALATLALNGATNFTTIIPALDQIQPNEAVGQSGDVLKFKVPVAWGSVATMKVDVLGYYL